MAKRIGIEFPAGCRAQPVEPGAQAHDLAADMPDKLAQLKETFAIEAARNSVYPIGGGLWTVVFHPELRISTPYREWNFTGDITRMPEFCAPALGTRANVVTINADVFVVLQNVTIEDADNSATSSGGAVSRTSSASPQSVCAPAMPHRSYCAASPVPKPPATAGG